MTGTGHVGEELQPYLQAGAATVTENRAIVSPLGVRGTYRVSGFLG